MNKRENNKKPIRRARVRRAKPVFQSSALVLAALHNTAANGRSDRHVSILIPCLGHLLVSDLESSQQLYQQAVTLAWGARSIDGLESLILSGMQTAIEVKDVMGAELGRTTLQVFPPKKRSLERPIIFLDRGSSMITVMSMEEFIEARRDILNTPNQVLNAYGVGGPIRAFNLDRKADLPARAFDETTCLAWVQAAIEGGTLVVTALAPEVRAGSFVVDRITRLATGVLFRRMGWAKFGSAALVGGIGARLLAPGICSGIEWAFYDKPSANGSEGSTQRVRPQDLGVTPKDFAPPEEEAPIIEEQPPEEPTSSQAPEGTVEEGEGFDAVQIDGATGFTITSYDGSGSTISVDNEGNTTVTSFDKDGNTTSVETYDSQGNGSSEPEPTPETPEAPETAESGYPVPDGDGTGGPLAFSASLVGYPVPDDLGTGSGGGPRGPQALVGRGATFLLSGQTLAFGNERF